MKIFLDTSVYIAEALLGAAAQRMIEATIRGRWRIYNSSYTVDEVGHVLLDDFNFSRRLVTLTQARIIKRATMSEGTSGAQVPGDAKDSPILQGALDCGADYLVSNDRHLLEMNPFHGLRIISMDAYYRCFRMRVCWVDDFMLLVKWTK